MGTSMSAEQNARRAQITTISRPQDLMMHIPRPRVDYNERAIRIEGSELDRRALEAALTTAANFIDNQGQHKRIITVAGAVNTLLLQNPVNPQSRLLRDEPQQ